MVKYKKGHPCHCHKQKLSKTDAKMRLARSIMASKQGNRARRETGMYECPDEYGTWHLRSS